MIFTASLEIPVSCAGGGLGTAAWGAWGPRWGIGRMCRLQRHQTKQNRAFSLAKTAHPNQTDQPSLSQVLHSSQILELDHHQE